MATIFPKEMLGENLSAEYIAERLSYFYEQIHLLHLQTSSHAEHEALNVWKDIVNLKDDILEKLMGCEGKKVKVFKISPLLEYYKGLSTKIMKDVKDFSEKLEDWAEKEDYSGIEALAQELNGKAIQTLYFLTLS
jgi:hypothetical protein